MLRRFFGRIAAFPVFYDLIQAAAGDGVVQTRIGAVLRQVPERALLIDLGGGTGLAGRSAGSALYVCVDMDAAKLRRFVKVQNSGARAVAGDAARCPIATGVADAVMAVKLTHHLDEAQFAAMFREAARIVRPGGLLLLADAVRSDRLASRLLWKLDRGAYPRSSRVIQDAAASWFAPSRVEEFSVTLRHRFLLWVGSRIPTA